MVSTIIGEEVGIEVVAAIYRPPGALRIWKRDLGPKVESCPKKKKQFFL